MTTAADRVRAFLDEAQSSAFWGDEHDLVLDEAMTT